MNRRAGMAATLAAGLIVWSGPLLEAAPAPQAAPQPAAPPGQTISAAATAQINALLDEKEARSPAQQKMDSQLIYATTMAHGRAIAAGALTLNSTLHVTLPRTADGRVELELRANVSTALLDRLRSLGAEIVGSNPEFRSIRVNVALAQVESIAALPDVLFVMPISEPTTAMKSPTGGAFNWGEWNRALSSYLAPPESADDSIRRMVAAG